MSTTINNEKYVATRQVLLDLLEAVKSGGINNESIGRLHIDAATDKIEEIWTTNPGEPTAYKPTRGHTIPGSGGIG